MKNLNNLNFEQMDHAITQQKHLAQSGQSALYIFNTLHVFVKEPIREQEAKLECMNVSLPTLTIAMGDFLYFRICWVLSQSSHNIA